MKINQKWLIFFVVKKVIQSLKEKMVLEMKIIKEEIRFEENLRKRLEFICEFSNDKVNNVISIIKNMNLKNKLRLGLCISSSSYINLNYNKSHIHSIFDNRLKKIDDEYLTSYVNIRKYPTILFVIAKLMKMNNTEQNQIVMFLYNISN